MRPVHLGAEPEEEYDQEDQFEDPDINHWMDQAFHISMVQAADSADAWFGCCFNYLEEGHRWRECTKLPLLPELQDILNREALNQKGGAGGKGGHTPNQRRGTANKGTEGPPPRTPSNRNFPQNSLPLLEPRRPFPLAGPREPRLGTDRRETYQGPIGHRCQGELGDPHLCQKT